VARPRPGATGTATRSLAEPVEGTTPTRSTNTRGSGTAAPMACVIGDLSLVRPLGKAGVPVVAVVSDPRAEVARSRYVREAVVVPDLVEAPEAAVTALVRYGASQPTPPVLYYQGDHDLLMVSRWRSVLAPYFRFVIPGAELVEDLVDKLRFAALAERLALPVPATRVLRHDFGIASQLTGWDRFPCVVKPALRTRWFGSRLHREALQGSQKAIRVETAERLKELLPILEAHETDFVVQEAVEGGEEGIVSYHAYVRPPGDVVAEFTGKKVRTLPRVYGLSSCVEITDDPLVKTLGREVLGRLGFHGVVKLDFKQDSTGGPLYLLEANPRYSLWHHPGAVAGVNLPYLVYRDLVYGPVSSPRPLLRPGVRWMSARHDLRALWQYRAAGELTAAAWMRQLATTHVVEDLSWSDPNPGLTQIVALISRLGAHLRTRINRRGRVISEQ
jgi:D-aspartate ligase